MNGLFESLPEDLAVRPQELPDSPTAADLSPSWDRSSRLHRLNPCGGSAPLILSQAEMKVLRAPLERTVAAAQEEIAQLHAMVRPTGYATLIAEPGGVIVERHCRAADAECFSGQGALPGALWTEQAEGTNGIGTCIVEQRPLNVHRRQHFRQRYADLSCSAAPIFDAAGRLQAVLTLASHAPQVSEHAHLLALAVAGHTARAIEERQFREDSRRLWTFALEPVEDGGPAVLLAVDADHRIVAADRQARSAFGLDACRLAAGVHLAQLFERYPAVLRSKGAEDLMVALQRSETGTNWHGLATPPQAAPGTHRHAAEASFHTRPRLPHLSGIRPAPVPSSPRGGLPPGILRSLRRHIEDQLDKNLPVAALAAIAGLSPTHFSRAFKNSTGVAPHHYLTRQRVEKAARLLIESELSMAEIAQAVGFSDQSHFTRCFTRLIGTTPGAYRHARR